MTKLLVSLPAWRRLFVCSAFATWCFLSTWVELAQGQTPYFSRFNPASMVVLPVVCLELIVTLALLAGWHFAGRYRERVLPHLLFLTACLAPIGVAAIAMMRASPWNLVPAIRSRLFLPLAVAGLLTVALFVLRRPRWASAAMGTLFLYSWPVLIVIHVQAVRASLRYPAAAYDDGALAPRLPGMPKTRAVWIVLDEASREIAFEKRPASLSLPNFDRLRAVSFYASAAESPSNGTLRSLPSLILGEEVEAATPEGPASLRIKSALRDEPFDWSSRPNLFDDVRAMGYNTALVGWFHPYGRVLNRSATECFWTAGWLSAGAEEPSEWYPLPARMWFRLRQQVITLPLLGHLPGIFPGLSARVEGIRRIEFLLPHAERVSCDPSVGLALLHLPVPHAPAVYSRRTGRLEPAGRNSYLDSLAFADHILGGLFQKMKRAGVWENSALILSSDHGWRSRLWRGNAEWTPEDEATPRQATMGVPFLVKLPGRDSPRAYDKPFSTVITRSVIAGILEGKLTKPEQVAELIDTAAARTASVSSGGSGPASPNLH